MAWKSHKMCYCHISALRGLQPFCGLRNSINPWDCGTLKKPIRWSKRLMVVNPKARCFDCSENRSIRIHLFKRQWLSGPSQETGRRYHLIEQFLFLGCFDKISYANTATYSLMYENTKSKDAKNGYFSKFFSPRTMAQRHYILHHDQQVAHKLTN